MAPYYNQDVSWDGCTDATDDPDLLFQFSRKTATCATVRVPLDYDDPGGRDIELAVTRWATSDTEGRIGSLFMVAGGPGQSGVQVAAENLDWMPDDVTRRFDIVGFDPRGVAASEPAVRCRTDAEIDDDRQQAYGSMAVDVALRQADLAAAAADCADRVGLDILANIGARQAARDLDILRHLVGDERINVVGSSYGAELVAEYAQSFPDQLRAWVLDSPADEATDPTDLLVSQAAGFQQSFDAFTRWCGKRSHCWLDPPATSPEDATRRYQELLRPLLSAPLETGDGRRLSVDDATTGTVEALYADYLWPDLDSALTDLQDGDGTRLLGLADDYHGRDAQGRYSNIDDVFTAINCIDEPVVTDLVRLAEQYRRYDDAAPFLKIDPTTPSGFVPELCACWPVPADLVTPASAVEGAPRPLVVAVTGDPATPYQGGVRVAERLGAHLLTVEEETHALSLAGVSTFADDAVTAYLVDGTPPADRW